MDGIVNPPGDYELRNGKLRAPCEKLPRRPLNLGSNYTRRPNNPAEKIAYIRYSCIDIETI